MTTKNLFDFDFSEEQTATATTTANDNNFYVERVMAEYEAEKRAERIRELYALAEEAYEENNLDEFFKLHDRIERLEAGEPEEEEAPAPIVERMEPLPKYEEFAETEETAIIEFQAQEIVLGCRKVCEPKGRIGNSKDVVKILRDSWSEEEINWRESFKVLYLDRANKVIGILLVGVGGLAECPVDTKVIFQGAFKTGASQMIVCHNHPSGQLYPSPQDDAITKRIVDGCNILGLKCLDHVILTANGHYSYIDNGKM